MLDRSSYAHAILVQATAQGAVENLNSFRGKDVFRIHPRRISWGKMVVSSGAFIGDIEHSLRKEMYDLQASAEDGDPFNLPQFAGKGTCSQFDLDEDEGNIAKYLLVELVANTRLNQALSIHPTTDAVVQSIDRERDEILQ